jgi:steroid delta-isomerase-like uncharacterized protein
LAYRGEPYAQVFNLAVVVCDLRAREGAADQSTRKKQGSCPRFFEEVLDQGHLDKYAKSHAKDFVGHGANHEYTLEEDMAAAREERKALPDMQIKVNQILAEQDLVAVYWTASGTNTQAGMGFPATGKKIKIDGMTIFRFKEGKIREEWSVWDMLSAMKQAGLLPPTQ